MHTIDIVLILVYLVLAFGIGFAVSKKASGGLVDAPEGEDKVVPLQETWQPTHVPHPRR